MHRDDWSGKRNSPASKFDFSAEDTPPAKDSIVRCQRGQASSRSETPVFASFGSRIRPKNKPDELQFAGLASGRFPSRHQTPNLFSCLW